MGSHSLKTLKSALAEVTPSSVAAVISALTASIAEIAVVLRNSPDPSAKTSSQNVFGDTQLAIDLQAEKAIVSHLRTVPAVHTIASEETPVETVVHAEGSLSVAFDPLDGSSILGSNFSVGTIAGVFKRAGLINGSGRDIVASLAAVYGSRTTVFVGASGLSGVVEGVLLGSEWYVVRHVPQLSSSVRLFAPANLRATVDNSGYSALVAFYMRERYTLRYTGGMVPDVVQVLVRGGGVFASPVSERAPAKLRLLYEAIPMAHLIESGGGGSSDGTQSLLHVRVTDCEQRTAVCLGSKEEVVRFDSYLQGKTAD